MASSQIQSLYVSNLKTAMLAAVGALPPRLQASLVMLKLKNVACDGPFFAPLAACTALREIVMTDSEFTSPEAANSLMLLTQVRRVGSTLAGPAWVRIAGSTPAGPGWVRLAGITLGAWCICALCLVVAGRA